MSPITTFNEFHSMKSFLITVYCILVTISTSIAGMAEDISSLKVGSWYEIPESQLKNSAYQWPNNKFPGVSFDGIMAWSGGVLDSKRNRLLIFGGGHTDYGGNEIYGFDLNDFKWHLIANPSEISVIEEHHRTPEEDLKPYYPDGLPVSRQTYNDIVYHPGLDAIISVGYRGGFGGGGDSGNFIDYFDLSHGKWFTNALRSFPDSSIKCVDVDYNAGHIWAYAMRYSRILWEYIPEDNVWYQRSKSLPRHDWNPKMRMNIAPDKKRLIITGYGLYYVFDISKYDENGYVSLVADQSTGPQDVVISPRPTLSYDQHSGYMVSWLGSTDVFALDINNNHWLRIPASNINQTTPTDPNNTGTFGRWQYVPGLNVFVLINDVNENIFLYKFSSDKTEESAPKIEYFSIPKSVRTKNFSVEIKTHDDGRILGYAITDNPSTLSAESKEWQSTPPREFRVKESGTYSLYLWVKDISGKITRSEPQQVVVETDDEPPIINNFSVKYDHDKLDIVVDQISVNENNSISGYLLTETSNMPPRDSAQWSSDPPKRYKASGCGSFTLYLWVKDQEGNIANKKSEIIHIKLNHHSKALRVGPRHEYKTINEAVKNSHHGAIVEIDSGVYINDFLIVQKDDLVLRGVGGYAHILGNKKISNGKALIVQESDNLIIENMELSGARVEHKNGAGVRGGFGNLLIKNSYFHDNENGLLVGKIKNGNITILNSIFDKNGDYSGQTHNIYVGQIESLTVRYCSVSNANIGHNIKSRAKNNYIEYNSITENDSSTSYSIDLPNGGNAYVLGNVIHQGKKPDNTALISYKKEKSAQWNEGKNIFIVNNTFINDYKGNTTILNFDNKTNKILFMNNLVVGNRKTVLSGSGHNNLIKSGNLFVQDDPGFKNRMNFDFRLTQEAKDVIDRGVHVKDENGYSLIPKYHYKDLAEKVPRHIKRAIDIGAYEFEK